MHSEIRSLTGLRGIAAIYVAIHHIHRPVEGGQISAFLHHGYLAVDLFFVLSGFVISMTYAEIFRAGFSGGAYRAFLIRRAGRIYPLYLVITLCTTALIILGGLTDFYGKNFPLSLVANLFMVQSWGLAVPIAFSSWSISTEWAAYILFPLIISNFLYGRKVIAVVGGVICVSALVTVSVVDWPIIRGSQTNIGGPLNLYQYDTIGPMVRCQCGFMLGVLTYRIRMMESVARILGRTSVAHILIITVIVLLCMRNTDIIAVAVFPALIAALSYERGIAAKILGCKPVYALGVWSYSIYLLNLPSTYFQHQLAGFLAAGSIPDAAAISTIATLTVVVTLSYYCHKMIEKPGRKLFQRLLKPHTSAQISPNQYQI